MKKLMLALFGVLGLVLVGGADPVRAQVPDIVVPIDTVVTGRPFGSETWVAGVTVPADLVGLTCDVQAIATNQASIHPNNDLVIRTGGSQVDILDVERAANSVTPAGGQVVLGSDVDIYLRMGPHTVFSAGMTVHLECVQPPPPTQPETTPPPPTQPAPTPPPTTAAPAPTPTSTPSSLVASAAPAARTPQMSTPTTSSGVASAGGSGMLPATGSGSLPTVLVALALLAGGVLLVRFSRRSEA